MISFEQKGDFKKLTKFLEKAKTGIKPENLNKYGEAGVSALANATPADTGLTANSWRYEIQCSNGKIAISFFNTNIQNGVPIAVIIQYGHATKNGGWVQGIDYINPALQPIFDKIADEVWREVVKS